MKLTKDQQQEIKDQQAQKNVTKRVTALELEKILYEAIPVLDHGFVRVVDYMGDDSSIVQAARVSYGKGTKTVNQDRGLIRYLMRHKHTTPFEMVQIKFLVKCPIFVARQWLRHRAFSYNEYSGRYSIMSDDFYTPEPERLQTQSKNNKQGTDEKGKFSQSTQMMMNIKMKQSQDLSLKEYQYYLDVDMSRELARNNLPVSNYTEFYMSGNLHNLFHFLRLRLDSHAQYEIQVYAEAIYDIIKPLFPLACEAFEDYSLNSSNLSKQEVDLITNIFESQNIGNTEIKEYIKMPSLLHLVSL